LNAFSPAPPPSRKSLPPTVFIVQLTRGVGRPPLVLTARQFIVTRMCTSLRQTLPSWPPKMKTLVPTRVAVCPTRCVGAMPLTGGSVQKRELACIT
jgi:hypothetical protein